MSDQSSMGFSGISKKVQLGKVECNAIYDGLFDNPEAPLEQIISSWKNCFDPFREKVNENDKVLRRPQRGAMFSILGYLTCSTEVVNIIMPTGTGKTETMIGSILLNQCKKVLILVPSVPLREQTFRKFKSLGFISRLEGFNEQTMLPSVGVIEHIPKSLSEINEIVSHSNIVIATPSSLGRCDEAILEHLSTVFTHLFVDEAHHVTAKTWDKIKKGFVKRHKPVMQFTATPFRNDGEHVDGRTIFNYKLKDAFEDEYFKKINFTGIREWDESKVDRAIAEKSTEILRRDLDERNLDHLMMVRTKTIPRSRDVFRIYQDLASDLNPVIIHSELSPAEKNYAFEQLKSHQSKIVVCVDMLGEGFDLPELKIAAIHDIHKSLPITLQFVGRFTRYSHDLNLGEAQVIADITSPNSSKILRELYSANPDWNLILQVWSENEIERQISLNDFIQSFDTENESIGLQNIRPKMSTVVFKISGDVDLSNEDAVIEIFGKTSEKKIIKYTHSERENVLVVVEGSKKYVEWGFFKHIRNLEWDLYLIYWDREKNLLFINSSNNGSLHENVAKALSSGEAHIVEGETIFRAFHDLKRIIFKNIGLRSNWGKAIRYTMYSGVDVEKGLSDPQTSTKIKSNLFGLGFEAGEKTSLGCSYKGRIWSRQVTNIRDFKLWCEHLGAKLLDESIEAYDFLKNSLITETALSIPESEPVTIEWDESIYTDTQTAIWIQHGTSKIPIDEVGIEISSKSSEAIKFKVFTTDFESTYSMSLQLSPEGDMSTVSFTEESSPPLKIFFNSQGQNLVDYFHDNPPVIRFSDGSLLEGSILAKPRADVTLYNQEKISAWDWTGVNIRKESQGNEKDPTSIQFKVIEKLKSESYDIIFDDDRAGEMADIIAIKKDDNVLRIEFYHCKFSSGDSPGDRVGDLYNVCGQAQKSIQWRTNVPKIFHHMIRRSETTGVNGFEVGDTDLAQILQRQSEDYLDVEMYIYVVQPGISKANIGNTCLSLLGVTESYLQETYQIPFTVISSS